MCEPSLRASAAGATEPMSDRAPERVVDREHELTAVALFLGRLAQHRQAAVLDQGATLLARIVEFLERIHELHDRSNRSVEHTAAAVVVRHFHERRVRHATDLAL